MNTAREEQLFVYPWPVVKILEKKEPIHGSPLKFRAEKVVFIDATWLFVDTIRFLRRSWLSTNTGT